jgi:DNA-binding NtrC family response regulator
MSQLERLLLIDSNKSTHDVCRRNLSDVFEIDIVETIQDALHLIKRKEFDMILLDQLNGTWTGDNIRAIKKISGASIVLHTVTNDSSAMNKLKKDVDAIVIKNTNYALIKATLLFTQFKHNSVMGAH